MKGKNRDRALSLISLTKQTLYNTQPSWGGEGVSSGLNCLSVSFSLQCGIMEIKNESALKEPAPTFINEAQKGLETCLWSLNLLMVEPD